MANAAKFDFEIEQGATWKRTLTLEDSADTLVNLTGYTALMQIRKSINSNKKLLELTHSAGLTLGGSAGTIVITISKTQTAAMDFESAIYDLKIDSGTEATRLLEGKITLDKQVSR